MRRLPELDGNGDSKDEDMKLEDHQEERSELIKHLNEKVPEQPKVGRQIADSQSTHKIERR